MIELNNLTRNLYFSNKISFKSVKENIWSSEIQRCYSRASSNVFAVNRWTSPRTFPRPVSRCEHHCDIHQRVINQSADILVPVRICGPAFKDHRASVIPWSARYPLSSNAVSILRLGLLRSSITNGCNCGADCVLNRLSRQSNSPYLLATVVAVVDEEREAAYELADEIERGRHPWRRFILGTADMSERGWSVGEIVEVLSEERIRNTWRRKTRWQR